MTSTVKDTITIPRENYDEIHSALLDALNDIDFLHKDTQLLSDFIHHMNLDEKYQYFKEHAREVSDPDSPFTRFTLDKVAD